MEPVDSGLFLDSMHLQFGTSDELAPGVDSNSSSRDSTGGPSRRSSELMILIR